MDKTILVKACKYSGAPHYQWETTLLEQTDRCIVVRGEQGRHFTHFSKQLTAKLDNRSIELYLPNEWFCVAADVKDGKISSWYCNVMQPIEVSDGKIEFVDVDLDVTGPDLEHLEVVDEDEFLEHCEQMQYPDWLVAGARNGVGELLRRVKDKDFPFDGTMDKWLKTIM